MPFTVKIEKKSTTCTKEAISYEKDGQSLLPNYILHVSSYKNHHQALFYISISEKKCLQYEVGQKQMRSPVYRVATDVLLLPVRTADIHYNLSPRQHTLQHTTQVLNVLRICLFSIILMKENNSVLWPTRRLQWTWLQSPRLLRTAAVSLMTFQFLAYLLCCLMQSV